MAMSRNTFLVVATIDGEVVSKYVVKLFTNATRQGAVTKVRALDVKARQDGLRPVVREGAELSAAPMVFNHGVCEL